MAESKVVSPEELEQLRTLADQHERAVAYYGQMAYQQFVIKKEIAAVEDALAQIDEQQLKLSEELRERFGGTGTVDLATGEFRPDA